MIQAQLAGLSYKISEMSRRRPDGVLLEWQLMFLAGHEFGRAIPFFIDWRQSPHPSLGLTPQVQYQGFTVGARPGAGRHASLDATLQQIELGEYIGSNQTDRFELIVNGPDGSIMLH